MRYIAGKSGYITEVRDGAGKLLKEVTVNGIKFRRNIVWKTYNSIVNNELLHDTGIK